VYSARAKYGKTEQPAEFTSPNEGKAFGFEWRLRWHGDADVIDSRPQLIGDLIPEVGVGLLSGQWGLYKTFVVFDLTGAVISGKSFVKFPVRRKGGVLFLACEGQSEVAIRLQAVIETKCPEMQRAPFAWLDSCPRLLDPNAAKILAAVVKQAADCMMANFGLPLTLIIIDTAGKAAGYTKAGDENDAALAKIIMKALATVAKEAGCFVLAVDHFGKNLETGTRGSSSKEDDADIVLALLGDKNLAGAVTNTRLAIRKRRNGSNGEEFRFRPRPMDMGTDAWGSPVATLVIEWQSEPETAQQAKPKEEAWTRSLRLLRQVLMNIVAQCGSQQRPYPDGPVVRAVDLEIVRAEFYKSYPADGDERAKQETRKKAFQRAIKTAQEKGLTGIRDIGAVTYVWLATPSTTGAAEA
jgi:AAA domain